MFFNSKLSKSEQKKVCKISRSSRVSNRRPRPSQSSNNSNLTRVISRVFTNRNQVKFAVSKVGTSEINQNRCGQLHKASNKVANYSVSIYNRFEVLNELPEINASSTEQGVGVDYHALTKCNVNKTKSSCKHDESSQVQDSETLADTFDNTDTAAVVK